MSKSNKRTITLTGRPPVTLSEDAWPLIASAQDREYDSEHEFQANRKTKWFVGVRQHDDGRAVVYATYSHVTAWRNERGFEAKRGVMLDSDASDQQICDAIKEVANDIADAEHNGDDASRWMTLANACIADMPAVELE